MKIIYLLIVQLLGGCLIVWTDEDAQSSNVEVGIDYTCRFRQNSVWRTEKLCGPLIQDPDYVLAHFPFKGCSQITCTATSDLCVFERGG